MLAMFGPTLLRRRRAGGRDAAAIGFAARALAVIVLFFTLSASKRPQYILTETGIGYRLRAPD